MTSTGKEAKMICSPGIAPEDFDYENATYYDLYKQFNYIETQEDVEDHF